MLDLQYHDLDPTRACTIFSRATRKGGADRDGSRDHDGGLHRPPEDTRAYFRGQCLKRYGNEVFGVNWDSISFRDRRRADQESSDGRAAEGLQAIHVEELLGEFDRRRRIS